MGLYYGTWSYIMEYGPILWNIIVMGHNRWAYIMEHGPKLWNIGLFYGMWVYIMEYYSYGP